MNHEWEDSEARTQAMLACEEEQIYRRRQYLKTQRVPIPSISKFLLHILAGSAVPALVLGYPLSETQNLDDFFWYYMVAATVFSLVVMHMLEKEYITGFYDLHPDQIQFLKEEIDQLGTREYPQLSRYFIMIVSGFSGILIAIFGGWMVPSWMFGISNGYFMVAVIVTGFAFMVFIAWKLSIQETLPQMKKERKLSFIHLKTLGTQS